MCIPISTKKFPVSLHPYPHLVWSDLTLAILVEYAVICHYGFLLCFLGLVMLSIFSWAYWQTDILFCKCMFTLFGHFFCWFKTSIYFLGKKKKRYFAKDFAKILCQSVTCLIVSLPISFEEQNLESWWGLILSCFSLFWASYVQLRNFLPNWKL